MPKEKRIVSSFDVPGGLLNLCSISSTELVCGYGDLTSLGCSVLQIETSAGSTKLIGAIKMYMPKVH